MKLVTRLWNNAAWELRFPLFIQNRDAFDGIMHPSLLRIFMQAARLLMRKIQPVPAARHAVLTFDDGPFEGSTEALLDVLREANVPATFFLVGDDARKHAASTKAIVAAGMELASHSKSHPRLTNLAAGEQFAEIDGGRRLIEEASGETLRYFRPPHGDFNLETLRQVYAADQTVSLWNINPEDYTEIIAETIVERVVDQQRDPAVILLHSGRPETIKAIPDIVRRYKEMGFTFTTIGRLQGYETS